MAQCKQSPQEFIKNAFTPQIAVITTPLVEKCCQKNNLSFVELLQPFSKLNSDVHYKDPSGQTVQLRGLKLTFLDIDSRPPQTTLARKYLNSSVSESTDFKTEIFTIGDCKLDITLTSPWFEAWRDTFLKVQYPSDHEYTKHFLACILVVSSSDTNPLDKIIELIQNLNQLQNNTLGKLPKWFNSNILKYYVIVHDNFEGNIEIAQEAYKSLKLTYGESNSFLLKINTRTTINSTNNEQLPDPWSQFINNNLDSKDFIQTPESSPLTIRTVVNANQDANGKIDSNYHPLSPDTDELVMNNSTNHKETLKISTRSNLHGHCLTTEDLEQIKLFIYEFCKSCLLPYIEKQMQILNDVISNKKGVSRSLFSATKRWFNPNKPGASSVAVNNLIYAPDSPELQIRRLGDLYFMFGNYNLAFQAYHLAKRDYNSDQAWLYYAGALEMAALAAFMGNESNRKTYDYMEESITTYLNTCKMPQFATRATLLSIECLKNRGLYGEAAHQLIRMTSEESDLRSALFLEQAAYCFLHSKMVRKYAFHMVLAGHRYSKAAQRKHSLRSYKQAHQIYENSGWDLAEDHIHYTIGRQAHNLHCFNEAVKSFARLLNGDSKQSAQQQNIFLKEYLTILENKLIKDNDNSIPVLVLPVLDINGLKLMMGPTPPLTTPGKVPALGVRFSDSEDNQSWKRWCKLEEMLVQEAQTVIPPLFQPMITLYDRNNLNKNQPLAIVNEPIQVCIHLINSLQILLHLKDIYLLCNFDNNDGNIVSNELPNNNSNNIDQYVKTHLTKSLLIQANSSENLIVSLTPLTTGSITLKGICYTLISSTTPSEIFITGKQLFDIEKIGRQSLEINVVPLAPCLQVTFSEINSEFLCDEIQKVTIDFLNTGTLPLCQVLMATSVPQLLCNCETKNELTRVNNLTNLPLNLKEKLMRENHVTSVTLPDDKLEPGQMTTMTIYVKAPNISGPCVIDLLIYYESINRNIKPRYRLVRHKWNLTIQDSVNVELSSQRSYNSKNVEELALVVKTTNLNKVHSSTLTDISLLNIGMLSKYWKLTEDVVTPKYINLSSQETAHVLLKAKRIINDFSLYSSIILNTERHIRQNINTVYMKFAKKTEYCQLNMFDEDYSNSNNNYNNINEKSKDEINNGIIFIQWQALINDINSRRVVNGQTQISIDINKINDIQQQIDEFTLQDPANLLEVSINREKNQDSNSSIADTKVTYNLIYPGIVEHDFEKQKLCIVPITLLLHNIVDDKINVIINTIRTSTFEHISRASLFYPYASKNFTWLGIGSAVKQLKPLSSDKMNLNVIITGPGTFDLGSKIEILCNTDVDQIPVVQNCQTQSTLIVIDGKS